MRWDTIDTVRHDFIGMHDLIGNFSYDDFFRKTHARLYWKKPKIYSTNKRLSLKLSEAREKLCFTFKFNNSSLSLFFHNFQITAKFAENPQEYLFKRKEFG